MYNWILKHRNLDRLNLIDPVRIVKGFQLNTDGTILSNVDFAYSDYIEVDESVTYYGTSSKASVNEVFITVLFYDENKELISSLDWGSALLDNFTPVAKTKFVRVSFVSEEASVPADFSELSLFADGGSFSPYYTEKKVTPIYKTLNRSFDKTSDEQFYRQKLDGNIKFINQDYDYIQSLNFRELIFITIQDLSEKDKISNFEGQFFKTDCLFDDDNKTVTVKVNPNDDYVRVIGGQNKSFNLSEKGLTLQNVETSKKPIIQVYTLGSPSITNIQGGNSWDEDIKINPIFYSANMANYGFNLIESFIVIENSYGGGGGVGGAVAPYRGRYNPSSNGVYTRTDGRFRIEFRQFTVGNGFQNWALIDNNNPGTSLLTSPSEPLNLATSYALLFQPFTKSGVSTILYLNPYEIYTRWITNKLEIDGTATGVIPENDIAELNTSYLRYHPYANVTFETSSALQDEPTVFGEVVGTSPSSGKYYVGLVDTSSDDYSRYIPVNISKWNGVSLWFKTDEQNYVDELAKSETVLIRNAFSLSNLIAILLREVGSSVVFQNTTEFSEILYSINNPIGSFERLVYSSGLLGFVNSGNIDHYLIPKQSFIENDLIVMPDKVNLTLKNVFDLLRNTYKIYWHIEDKKLRLEHISWYQNGGTYDANNKIIALDLTKLRNPRNGKNWGFGLNKWSYDKQNMPERYEFEWMDKVSVFFEGYPIQINDEFVELGNIKNNKIAQVTTDLDTILTRPGEMSKNGLILLGTVNVSGSNVTPFTLVKDDVGKNRVAQNGFLSFAYLHPKFYVFDLPSNFVNINGIDLELTDNVSREKQQNINYPFFESSSPFALVKTGLGVGSIDSFKVNLESKMVEAVIKHDTNDI